jgi:hypothetical protein
MTAPTKMRWRAIAAETTRARRRPPAGSKSATSRIAVSAAGRSTTSCSRAATARTIATSRMRSRRSDGRLIALSAAQMATRQSGYARFSLSSTLE